jgi:hypothetical protein
MQTFSVAVGAINIFVSAVVIWLAVGGHVLAEAATRWHV